MLHNGLSFFKPIENFMIVLFYRIHSSLFYEAVRLWCVSVYMRNGVIDRLLDFKDVRNNRVNML